MQLQILSANEVEKENLQICKEIFFENTTVKNFKNSDDKEKFYYKYLGYYLDQYLAYSKLAFWNRELVGYLIGMPETLVDEKLMTFHSYLKSFEDELLEFPAHLHINLVSSMQGKGIGGKLIAEFEAILKQKNISGFHIITNPNAANVIFYTKQGLRKICTKEIEGQSLLLMGKYP